METTMTLLSTSEKGEGMKTLENYYIQLFYHQGKFIKEQTHKK
jgi:hypothetical protein